ncbi:ribokinase [Paenibacillus sp. J2TS4]|uniref:ribokinase n=1 Tax=Paenibacillus sp. J2TS4 TaxID=2807194 RepID=UPI001BCFD9A7|nr:ribokinase [Paenibacillus sp. J2TS4]
MSTPSVVVIGSINMDIMVESDEIPQAGQTRLGTGMTLYPGGKGANQAVAASKLNADVSLIGAIGADAFGMQILDELQRCGVAQGIAVLPEAYTGVASIWVHDQDNRIIVAPGANNMFTWSTVQEQAELIDAADIVLLQLEIPLDTVAHTIEYAARRGKRVILNPAPARELPDHLYPQLHAITPNLDELAVLAEAPGLLESLDEATLQEAMGKMIAKGLHTVLVTLGSEGAAYRNADGLYFRISGRKVQVLDTTGAGDCFNAAYAVAVANGWDPRQAVEYAVAASALAVTRYGAQNGMPTWDEVLMTL